MSRMVDTLLASFGYGHEWLALATFGLVLTALIAGFIQLKPILIHVRGGNDFYSRRCRTLARRCRLTPEEIRRIRSMSRRYPKNY